LFIKPEIAVRTGYDANRLTICSRDRKFIDDGTAGSNAANLVRTEFSEPVVTIKAWRDTDRVTERGRHQELGNDATCSDAANIVRGDFSEPEIAIRAKLDVNRLAPGCGDGKLSNGATGGNTPDLVPKGFSEPEVAVTSNSDVVRLAGSRLWGPEIL